MLRGQADAPLTPAGRAEAHRVSTWLRDSGCLTHLYTSSAQRAVETGKDIVAVCPTTTLCDPAKELLSWSLGEYEGDSPEESADKIAKFVKYLPSVALPGRSKFTSKGGESFDEFRWRVLPFLGKRLAEFNASPKVKLGLVTHHRVVKLIKSWLDGGMSPFMDVAVDVFNGRGEVGHPASVFVMKPTGPRSWSFKELNTFSKSTLEPGVYLIRHASTKYNSAFGV